MSKEPVLPKKAGLFITGTDTGVGKTLIAGAIAGILAGKGLKVGVFKPVATGCRREREGLVSNDAEFLACCADSRQELSVINPVSFFAPAAPVVCEKDENRSVDFEAIITAYNYISSQTDIVIVEGIGGVRVPISQDKDVLWLMCLFDLPVVVVSRPGLGTINHTLLTIDAVRSAGLNLAGVVMNGFDADRADLAEQTAAQVIEEWGRVKVLSIVPEDAESCVEEGRLGKSTVEVLSICDWEGLAGEKKYFKIV